VRRSYKFVLRPTKRQEATLGECLEDARLLYNAALEERREAWRMGGHQTSFAGQDAQLKEIRADDPERYGRWAFACERAAVRRLDRAFQGFFRRVKAGERPGYPRFKGRGWWDSIEWPLHGNGCKWNSVPRRASRAASRGGRGGRRRHGHRIVPDH
jgi:putative transposase